MPGARRDPRRSDFWRGPAHRGLACLLNDGRRKRSTRYHLRPQRRTVEAQGCTAPFRAWLEEAHLEWAVDTHKLGSSVWNQRRFWFLRQDQLVKRPSHGVGISLYVLKSTNRHDVDPLGEGNGRAVPEDLGAPLRSMGIALESAVENI